jgi:hypothetical protein
MFQTAFVKPTSPQLLRAEFDERESRLSFLSELSVQLLELEDVIMIQAGGTEHSDGGVHILLSFVIHTIWFLFRP